VITRLGGRLCPLEQFGHVIHDAKIQATLQAAGISFANEKPLLDKEN
jgi:hypothetical protein